jgi:CheY-like chemotaxis protein
MSKRILVIEHTEDNRQIIRELLIGTRRRAASV